MGDDRVSLAYIKEFNPTREVCAEAEKVHGKSKEYLEQFDYFGAGDAQDIF